MVYLKNFSKNSVVIILMSSFLILTGCSSGETTITPAAPNSQEESPQVFEKADKIEVVHFHATQQCHSCITVGEYALKTIEENFPEEYKNGIITFKDINGELPENYDTVVKYQARGSSLFVNAIADGNEYIEEDVNVWRLIGNEDQFKSYFGNKLSKMLGK